MTYDAIGINYYEKLLESGKSGNYSRTNKS